MLSFPETNFGLSVAKSGEDCVAKKEVLCVFFGHRRLDDCRVFRRGSQSVLQNGDQLCSGLPSGPLWKAVVYDKAHHQVEQGLGRKSHSLLS